MGRKMTCSLSTSFLPFRWHAGTGTRTLITTLHGTMVHGNSHTLMNQVISMQKERANGRKEETGCSISEHNEELRKTQVYLCLPDKEAIWQEKMEREGGIDWCTIKISWCSDGLMVPSRDIKWEKTQPFSPFLFSSIHERKMVYTRDFPFSHLQFWRQERVLSRVHRVLQMFLLMYILCTYWFLPFPSPVMYVCVIMFVVQLIISLHSD